MAAVALTCAACANEPQPSYLGMRANAFRTGALARVSPAGAEPAEPARKSLAAKMLTAIALEKVTGLKRTRHVSPSSTERLDGSAVRPRSARLWPNSTFCASLSSAMLLRS